MCWHDLSCLCRHVHASFVSLLTIMNLCFSTHSYLHHKWKKGNFGGFPTGMWDKIFGTEIDTSGQPSSTDESSFCSRLLNWGHWSFFGFVRSNESDRIDLGFARIYVRIMRGSTVVIDYDDIWTIELDDQTKEGMVNGVQYAIAACDPGS